MKMVALLRGINVGGNRKVPMKELCSIAVKAGFKQIETYINSGNLVFESEKNVADSAVLLEKLIHKHFGFPVDVVVRTKSQWKSYETKRPFADAAEERPHLLMLGLSKSPLAKDTQNILIERAAPNERIKIVGDAIWIDFAGGSGKSKITPAWLDKAAGSPVTLRNWRTVIKISEMLNQL